jgi:MFS transporter, DHA1 family, multidrug resistance protein
MHSQLRRLHLSVFAASIGIAYVYLIPAFAESLGAGYLDLGLIGTVRALPYTFLPVIAGYLGDRLGRRRLYLLSIFAVGSATLLLAATGTIEGILAVQLILGIGLSLFWPISEALVSEISSAQERVSAIGKYAVAWGIGFLIGPFAGGIIAQLAGFQATFFVAGVLILITAVLSVVTIRGEQKRHGSSEQASAGPSWHVLSAVLPMLIVQVPYAIVLAFIVSIFPGYAIESGLTPSEVGLLLSGFGFARTMVFSLSGRLGRIGERKSVGFAFLVMIPVLLLIPLNRSFIGLFVDSCFLGACIGIIYPQTVAIVSKGSPPQNLGFAIGAYETIFGVGFAVGPILLGFVAQTAGPDLALLVLAIVSLSAIPVLAFSRRDAERTEVPAQKS